MNSRDVNNDAHLMNVAAELSTEKIIEFTIRPDYPCHFFFLEGHSANFQSGFLDALKRNESTAETNDDDFRIHHLRFILTEEPPIVPRRIRTNHRFQKLPALRPKHLPNKLLLSSRCPLVHSVYRFAQFPFNETQIVVHGRV